MKKSKESLNCSFCGKSQEEVKKLIAGPDVYICNECIELCNEILSEDNFEEQGTKDLNLLTPRELSKKLDDYVIGQQQAKKGSQRCGAQPLQAYSPRQQDRSRA